LLRLVALRESDGGWRWKDWEDLSYLEFWQGRTRTEFVSFVKHELDHNSQRFIEELFSWLQIATRLKARDSHPEARLMDLASRVLFFSGDDLLVTVTDRLARDFEKDGHQSLLILFAERRRREMVVAIERWKLSHSAHLETLSLFSRAFHSLSPSARKPMLHSVTPYGSLSSLDRQLLEIAVQSENDEDNLQHFLSMIPKIDLPFDEMFRLVQGIGLRQTFYPAGIAVLVAALEDHGFADFVASMNSDWSGPMSALSEFRDLTKSGSETREAIFEVLMRHRSEWP
jgi:hypothetical protein